MPYVVHLKGFSPNLRSSLLIKLKNQPSLLISTLDSKCKIRLDNLEFSRISKGFSNLFWTPTVFYGVEIFFRGEFEGFFIIFILDTIVMYFLHFKAFRMKWILFLFKFLLYKVCWSYFSPLAILITNFRDVAKFLFVIYLFFFLKNGRLIT